MNFHPGPNDRYPIPTPGQSGGLLGVRLSALDAAERSFNPRARLDYRAEEKLGARERRATEMVYLCRWKLQQLLEEALQ